MNNTTLISYVSALKDAQAIYQELEKIRQLYEEYLETRTTIGGGSGGGSGNSWADAINNFWNSLDWQVKAMVIGGGILVGLVLIGRSFGKGGVSVIRMGK